MGANITSIDDAAFQDCPSLLSIYCKAIQPPMIGAGTLYNFLHKCGYEGVFSGNTSYIIYVPIHSEEYYKTTDGWSYYADNIVGYDF